MALKDFKPEHFLWKVDGKVATLTLNRPKRKNALTFDSYGELRDTFRNLSYEDEIKTVVITGQEGNFCSGGDVHDIIGTLVEMEDSELLTFTRMTGALIKAMRACPQPIIAAIDGVCAGAGAAMAMASDIRFGTPASDVAFLFSRVGLAGCDMGACSLLPRIIGHGRACELLLTGRNMTSSEASAWGFYNKIFEPNELLAEAQKFAQELAAGPTFAHSMTKKMLHVEWDMSINDAIDAEAKAQSVCMHTKDFERAYLAFIKRQKPIFEGD